MKFKNYLVIKIGEVILVIVILILCLTIRTHGQVHPSHLYSNGMLLQPAIDNYVLGPGQTGLTENDSFNFVIKR
jgi:hypothetical protein